MVHDRVNLVWISGSMKYRPSFETVDLFLSGLNPSILLNIKRFVVVGKDDWLNLMLTWLKDHYPSGNVSMFMELLSFIDGLEQLNWPKFKVPTARIIQHRVFGEPIGEDGAPPSILDLIQWIRTTATTVDGIFRMSADSTRLEWLKSLINAGRQLDMDKVDPNEVACLLKMYFRDLPTPVVPRHLYSTLIQADDQDDEDRIQLLKTTILPQMVHQNQDLLWRLMQMLSEVAQNEKTNRMNAKNLAICWAPNLIYDERAKDQFRLLKSSLNTVELMIKRFSDIFL